MNDTQTPTYLNVDKQEIEKFESIASRWWDLEGEFAPLHRINPLRLGYIMQRVDGVFGKKFLMLAVVVAFCPKVWRVKAQK